MLGFYTPVFVLQAFCVYHAYRNNSEQRWYWLILFFPLVGCIIYLVHHFRGPSISSITENVKGVVISNYKIEQLEKALRFSDNTTNKINLADEYVKLGRYREAIELYASCLVGFMNEDPELKMKLVYAHFMNEDYAAAVEWGDALKSEKTFKNAEERVVYAWALHQAGKSDQASANFKEMDKSFTNYYHRKEYCKFLIVTEKTEQAKEKLSEMIQEFDHAKGPERRFNRNIFREVRDMYAQLTSA